MIFQQSIIANSVNGALQWDEVQLARNNSNLQEESFVRNGQLAVNDGLIPRDVYQEFDNVTVEQFRSDEGDTVLNDLLPMSKSVSIGRLVHKFRQSSDAGNAQTSMSGQIGVNIDQVEYTYDGTIVPVYDTGFGRNWREWAAQRAEGFDALVDDQRETVRTIRTKVIDGFMDGHRDKDGTIIVFDGLSWGGIRNDSRVVSVDLGAGGVNFDFTDNAQTGADNKANFIEIRNIIWITNSCQSDLVYYVSREIASNWERKFSTQYDAKIIMQELADLMGVAAIKVTSKLTGNQLMGFPLDRSVRPIVGMGINTVAMPRPLYNSNYNFAVWGAIGFEVRTDYDGNSCAFYASV